MEFVDFDASAARQAREACLFAAQALDATASRLSVGGGRPARLLVRGFPHRLRR